MTEMKIDQILATKNRMLRTYPGKLLFGPAADRLFVDVLDKKPGFCGNIDFIHKVNLDMLFEIVCSHPIQTVGIDTMWYPSHLHMQYEDDVLAFDEDKYMDANDIAYCVGHWTNKSDAPLTLTLRVEPTGCLITKNEADTYFQMNEPLRDYRVGVCAGWSAGNHAITVAPGETVEVFAAAAAGNVETESQESICQKLRAFLAEEKTPAEHAEASKEAYEKFFDQAPQFESSDLLLNKTWWYRWYILRNATSKPDFGYLKHPTVYEGRAHKTSKYPPLTVRGWEFSRLINLSSPLQMMDYGWFPDKELLHEFVRGFFSVPNENGVLQSAFTNHIGGGFANFLVWAVYRMYLIDHDIEFVKELIPAIKRYIDGNILEHGAKNDLLQIEVKHARTGMEFQPSFWYFSDFPLNGKDKSKIVPMKRLDTSVYHYLNMKGGALLMQAAGDADAEHYMELANTLAAQINEKTWDEETGFYYDLHHETDEKAMVKNIVGVFPFWADIAGEEKLAALEKLFDPAYFNTGSVFSTVARDCVAYAPYGGWMGSMKTRDSCMWDGPSWPFSNGIVLDAVGMQSKKYNHKYDGEFRTFLEKYALQHYRNGNLAEPYLVEQYHAETGENLSDEPDYNHSYFLNLIVSHVAGLEIQEDRLILDPVDVGLRYFTLSNLWIRGTRYEIGLTKDNVFYVKANDEIVASSKGLSRLELAL